MTLSERIAALEARRAATEARIAALERPPAPIYQQPYMPCMPQTICQSDVPVYLPTVFCKP